MLSRSLQRVPKALPRGSRGMAVIHSKFPDVELPKEPLTEYILKVRRQVQCTWQRTVPSFGSPCRLHTSTVTALLSLMDYLAGP